MCVMCVEIAKERMTFNEARKALPEMIATATEEESKRHYQEMQNSSDDELKELVKKSSD